jgi:hypothetical protein
MTGTHRSFEALIVAATAALVAVTAPGGAASAVEPRAAKPAPAKTQYKLPPEALASLPAAIVTEILATPPNGGPPRKGAQVFQSKASIYATYLVSDPREAGGRLHFPTSGVWNFLPDKRFAVTDEGGNRLILSDGKAEIFRRSGSQIGAFHDPALRALYKALLKLTM